MKRLLLLAFLIGVESALAADAGLIRFGSPMPIRPTGTPAFNSAFAIDQSTDKIGTVAAWPENSEAITQVCFRVGLRTGTPVQHKITLQSVDTSGLPSGTVLGGGSPAVQAFTPPASSAWDGTIQCQTLVNSYTPARGEILAIVIEPCPDATSPCSGAATPDGSNNITISYAADITTNAQPAIPYSLTNPGGAGWAKSTGTNSPVYAFKTASRTVGNPVQAWNTISNYNTGTEYGNKCTFPAFGSAFTVVGLRWWGRTAASGTDVIIRLYDGGGASDTTVLQNFTLDSDMLAANAGVNRYHEIYFDEATLSTLNWGSTYRASITTSGAAANINLAYLESDTAGSMSAYPGGSNCMMTTRTTGNWTDTSTQRPLIDFIIKDTTATTASSGVIGG